MTNKQELLDEILLMIRSFAEDPIKLEKLHQYIKDELYEEPEEIKVPEKYQPLVKDVADSLSAGLVCYINPETLDKMEFPENVVLDMMYNFEEDDDPDADELDDDESDDDEPSEFDEPSPFEDDFRRMQKEWKNTITIEPPKSHLSFSYMEDFVNDLPIGGLKNSLIDALENRKPFKNFNAIIHQSPVREEWFAFRQKCLENYVTEELGGNLPDFNL